MLCAESDLDVDEQEQTVVDVREGLTVVLGAERALWPGRGLAAFLDL